MLRLLLLPLLILLRFSLIWTQCVHSIVLKVCNCFENLFRVSTATLDKIYEPLKTEKNTTVKKHDNSVNAECLTVSTQTSLNKDFSGFRHRENDNIDVFIYNLKSEQKVKIKHKALKKKYANKNNYSHCQRCKSKIEKRDNTYSKTDNLSFKIGDTFTITESDLSENKNANCSNMSIEKEVSDSQIILNSKTDTPDLNIRNENLVDKSTQYFPCDFRNDKNSLPYFEECEEKECDNKNISPREASLEDRMDEDVHTQHQTSSPFEHRPKFVANEQRANFDTAFHNNQNAMLSEKIKTPTEIIAESPTSCQFNKRDSILENTVLLDESVKKRLSSSFNAKNSATKEAVLSLKTIKDEIFEIARKTPRYEVNAKEIKFPYQSEVNGLLQTLDDKEEAKEVFSSSSYESLPVSDHLRTAFEKSILSSLYADNFANITEPDFSSVDSLVEAFRKFESAIAFGELGKNQFSERFVSNTKNKNFFERELSVEPGRTDQRQNEPCIRKALSSGMLNTNCLLKEKFQDFSELRYQSHNQYFTPVKSTSLKSVTSSLPSISDAEVHVKESEFNKSEKSGCFENKLQKSHVEINDKDLMLLSDRKENKSSITESNHTHSGFSQFEKIEDIPGDNKENETVSERTIPNVFKSNPKLEQTEPEKFKFYCMEKEDIGKIKPSKTLTDSKGEIDKEPSRTTYSLTSNLQKSEMENNWSLLVDIDSSEVKISSNESLNENANLINEEHSMNSMGSDDIKDYQSIMNNDIDKYKITYIDANGP